ncbi:MAG: hypothetical protein MUF03_09190, partial [Rubrivivax sp.]|nr:hypothetical protein [Rubrivivax sp.]
MSSSIAAASASLRALPPLIVACLAATWLIWGSTYLAIKWALVSLPPFFHREGSGVVASGTQAPAALPQPAGDAVEDLGQKA